MLTTRILLSSYCPAHQASLMLLPTNHSTDTPQGSTWTHDQQLPLLPCAELLSKWTAGVELQVASECSMLPVCLPQCLHQAGPAVQALHMQHKAANTHHQQACDDTTAWCM
jgi:hypothetical protein